MTCPYCKSEIPDKSNFCPNCGEKIKTEKGWGNLILSILIITLVSLLAGILIYSFGTKKEQTQKEEQKWEENYYNRNYETTPEKNSENYNQNYPTTASSDIKILAPNGNEKICKNSTYTIRWEVLNPEIKNKYGRISIINMDSSDGATYSEYSLDINVPLNKESYQWNRAGFIEKYNINLSPGNYYKIKISAEKRNNFTYETHDESDNYFSIVDCNNNQSNY